VQKYQAKSNFFGGIRPVIQRELREGARRPFNHRLRVLAAAAGTLLLWIVVANLHKPAATVGTWLFTCLHALLLWLICLFVPSMTADCVAREKREGTLGLLFLTPLTAMGIVLGKGIVQALRAFTIWLAVLPVLTIPFLLGGVGRIDVFRAIGLEFCAAVLCLAAGLLASSLSKSRGAAFVLAFLFAASFMVLLGVSLLVCFNRQSSTTMDLGFFDLGIESLRFIGLIPDLMYLSYLYFGLTFPVTSAFWLQSLPPSILVVLLLYFLVAWFAARRIDRTWRDTPPSPRKERLLKEYCTPLFRHWHTRRMRRAQDRNPIAWLQQYSWRARLVKWGFCLAFIVIECLALTGNLNKFDSVQEMLLWVLAAACTFVGVNSFLAEKRSGALELILVTPIPVNKIIIGRVRGLWGQFLPAALILAVCDAATPFRSGDYFPPRFIFACGFLVLPFCATYFALRVKNLIVAAALTWVALLLPPCIVAAGLSAFGMDLDYNAGLFCFLLVPANLALVLLVCFLLRHSLSRRIYSF
jgi:ABC-type transport system involved in multi-copper enzyme maturation permease subunit